MMTQSAVCTDTAEVIKTEVEQLKGDWFCKNTADGGVRFYATRPTGEATREA